MAIRHDELEVPGGHGALVFRFPTHLARRRAAAQQRRYRLLRTLVVAALLVAATLFVTHSIVGSAEVASRSSAPAEVTIRSGETLWDIATRYEAPNTDTRAYLDALEEANDLEGAAAAGDRLVLP